MIVVEQIRQALQRFSHAGAASQETRPAEKAKSLADAGDAKQGEETLYVCRLCHFSVTLDDAVRPGARNRCICLSCYLRACGLWQPVPKDLREEVSAVLKSTAGPV
jgi:hypothetical protein